MRWEAFSERHGDWGRDLALLLGRKRCGLKLAELGQLAVGLDYVRVSTAIRRLEQRVGPDLGFKDVVTKALGQMQHEKM